MLPTLARQLGTALLAIAMIAAPVIGAQPRCCKTGAIKGSGQCCCGPHAASSQGSSCCQAQTRSCCASQEEASDPDATPALADTPCRCKATGQQPAIPSSSQGSEFSLEAFVVPSALPAEADDSQLALIARGHEPSIPHGGMSLLKVHCRWTI